MVQLLVANPSQSDFILSHSGPQVSRSVVEAWIKHVASRGIRRLLCLLTSAELGFYDDDLLALYRYALHGNVSPVYRSLSSQ